MASKQDALFVQVAVERDRLDAHQIAGCLVAQAKLLEVGLRKNLAELAVEKGFMADDEVQEMLLSVLERGGAPEIGGYEIVHNLGTGAAATVYKAIQSSTGRIFALKVLSSHLSNNAEVVELMRREAAAVMRLNHPNIIQGVDTGKAQDCYYFVMEYVEGETLSDLLRNGGALAEERACEIAIQLSRALEQAHSFGIVHRDMKPGNVIIGPDGKPMLGDFGLALNAATGSVEGAVQGTPYYMSPEQIRGHTSIDGRSDLYSLGATFFHMVTGCVPFEGPSAPVVFAQHLSDPAPSPRKYCPSVTDGTCAIIEQLMAKNPDDRYPSATELAADLEAVLRGERPMALDRMLESADEIVFEDPSWAGAAGRVASRLGAGLRAVCRPASRLFGRFQNGRSASGV